MGRAQRTACDEHTDAGDGGKRVKQGAYEYLP